MSASGKARGRTWGRPSIELSLEEVMADPIVHLVMRRDRLAPDDVWTVVDDVPRRHRRRNEQKSSRTALFADNEV